MLIRKRKIIFSLLCIICSICVSFEVNAKTFSPNNELRVISYGPTFIQRIYNGENLVFTYTHDITYHFDQSHIYTDRVEHGTSASQYAELLATSNNINTSSYTPKGATGTWKLVGWKMDDSANNTDILDITSDKSNIDLYAVWAKECAVYFNFNGGSCTAWNSFGTDWYARGNAYYNNGNVTPFSFKLPTVARSNYTLTSITGSIAGSYAQGGTYNTTDNISFTCNWRANTVVLVDSDFTCTNANEWDIQMGAMTVPPGQAVYISLTPINNAFSYGFVVWQNGAWGPDQKFYGNNYIPIGSTQTLVIVGSGSWSGRILVKSMMSGSGWYSNDRIHVKIWIQ